MDNLPENPEFQENDEFTDDIKDENTVKRLQRWLENTERLPGEAAVQLTGRHRRLGTAARSEG